MYTRHIIRGTSKIPSHTTPGWPLFFPDQGKFCDSQDLISITLAFIGYVAPVKTTDSDPSNLLDEYLINGRFDHSRKMNGKVSIQDWLTEDDKLLADLESACIAADMEYLIPTDQQIRTNYQTAASDSLWTTVMRQLEHESIQAGYSVLIKHKSLAEIRLLLCRAQETNDTKQANNQVRISKPKTTVPKDSKTATRTKKKAEAETASGNDAKSNNKQAASTMSKQDIAARTEARKEIDCQYWKEGTCRLDKKCEFKHDPALKNSQDKQPKKTTNETAADQDTKNVADVSQDDGEEFSLAFTQPLKDVSDSNGSLTWDTRVVSSGRKTVSVVHSEQKDMTELFNTNRFQALSSSDDQPDDHEEWLARMQSKGNRHGSGKEVAGLLASGAEILEKGQQRSAKNTTPRESQQPHWMPNNTKQVLLMDVGNELQHVIRSDTDLEEDNSIDLESGSDEEAKVDNLQNMQQSITSYFAKISPMVAQSNVQSVYYSSNLPVTAAQMIQDYSDSDDEDMIMPSTNSDAYGSCQCMQEDHDHCNICGQCQGDSGCCNCDDIPIKSLNSITPAQHFR